MDLRLPDMDGVEATRNLWRTERTAGIPVVAMSASPLEEATTGWRSGFAGWLEKPIHASRFPEQVRRYSEQQLEAPGHRATTPVAPGRHGGPEHLPRLPCGTRRRISGVNIRGSTGARADRELKGCTMRKLVMGGALTVFISRWRWQLQWLGHRDRRPSTTIPGHVGDRPDREGLPRRDVGQEHRSDDEPVRSERDDDGGSGGRPRRADEIRTFWERTRRRSIPRTRGSQTTLRTSSRSRSTRIGAPSTSSAISWMPTRARSWLPRRPTSTWLGSTGNG